MKSKIIQKFICHLSLLKREFVEFFILDFSVAMHGRSAESSVCVSVCVCSSWFYYSASEVTLGKLPSCCCLAMTLWFVPLPFLPVPSQEAQRRLPFVNSVLRSSCFSGHPLICHVTAVWISIAFMPFPCLSSASHPTCRQPSYQGFFPGAGHDVSNSVGLCGSTDEKLIKS